MSDRKMGEKKRSRMWKSLCGWMTVVLIAVNLFSVKALAADGTVSPVPSGIVLTGLNITYLDMPTPREPLDNMAVVVSDQQVSWAIPVIWTDARGNIVTVPVAGEKYYPVFVFFLPEGYSVGSSDPSGRFWIKLPWELTQLYGTDGLVFAVDPSLGITYIMYGLEYQSIEMSRTLVGVNDEIQRISAAESNAVNETVSRSSRSNSSDDDDDDNDDPGNGGYGGIKDISGDEGYNGANDVSADEIPETVRIHCTEQLISQVDAETLEWVVRLIKERLEPQAVNLLLESFPVFAEAAANEEISDEIGLLLYFGDDQMFDGAEAPGDAVAFVSVNLVLDEDNEIYAGNILAINFDNIMQWDVENETYVLSDCPEFMLDIR